LLSSSAEKDWSKSFARKVIRAIKVSTQTYTIGAMDAAIARPVNSARTGGHNILTVPHELCGQRDISNRSGRGRARRNRRGIGEKWVVCTGGEPALQLDTPLVAALHKAGFKIAIETNGTLDVAEGVDWICVSPKANATLVQTSGHELKLVYPQPENDPSDFVELDFEHFCLQPRDDSYLGVEKKANHSEAAFQYCLDHPIWRLSVQTHKTIGVP